LFETGAIILHIAERDPGLLPDDPDGRARAIAWMFAAKSTVEPPIVEREAAILLEKDKDWFEARLPILDERVGTRLRDLSNRLGEAEWLDGEFSAGDLLMINVLRRPAATTLLDERLAAYVARGEARPAFKRAFEAQHALFLAASAA
jgi:glutathione S-transferase